MQIAQDQKQNINTDICTHIQRSHNTKIATTGQQIRAKIQKKLSSIENALANSQQLGDKALLIHKNLIENNNQSKNMLNFYENSNKKKSRSRSVKFMGYDSPMRNSIPGKQSGSILKNKIKQSKTSQLSQKYSITSSMCSHNKYNDQSVDNQSVDEIFKEKYYNLLSHIQNQFIDEIYPPNRNSLYLNNSQMKIKCQLMEKQGQFIQWLRLPDLYPSAKLKVWNQQHKKKCRIIKGAINMGQTELDYLPTAFNSIKYNNYILEKMFESQQINSKGIYYVKIHQTQTNSWKYVMIDDYVPVVVHKNSNLTHNQTIIEPAFLKVIPQLTNQVEIWSFLLQKAYAKYYSSYDALFTCGNTFDFLQQLTGVFLQKLFQNESFKLESQTRIDFALSNPDCFLIAKNKQGLIYPFRRVIKQDQRTIIVENSISNFKQQMIKQNEFYQQVQAIFCGQFHKYLHTVTTIINEQKQINRKHNNFRQYGFILRSFNITEPGLFQIGIIQKQNRFYKNCNYKYSWIRLLVGTRDTEGYRWIQGFYSCSKNIHIQCGLQCGKHYIILIPQWTKPCNINLVLCGNTPTTIIRDPYSEHKDIIEQLCMDLAQRYGKLIQISKDICSYNYIHRSLGFIIENINNQRTKGDVLISRSMKGLQGFQISPINQLFQKQSKITTRIKPQQHFTVVLQLLGGIDKQFLSQFNFGS